MIQEIKTTKMLLDERMEKLRELNIKEVLFKAQNEKVKRQNEELASANTELSKRAIELRNDIERFETIFIAIRNDISIYTDFINELYQIKEESSKTITDIYLGLDKRMVESQEKFNLIKKEAKALHENNVKEQEAIQSQKGDLKIYRERLQKKYDELNFGEIILVDKQIKYR